MMSPSPARPMATDLTGPLWPASGPPTRAPVTASQTRTVPSSEPDTMMSQSPTRPMATVLTQSSWSASGPPIVSPVTASQTRTVLSAEPETMTSRSLARPIATPHYPVVMAGQRGADGGAGDRVPDPHRPIVGAGDDDVAVSDPPDGHRVHRAVVAGQRGADAGRR